MADVTLESGWTQKSKGLFFIDTETVRISVYETKKPDCYGNVWAWSITDLESKQYLQGGKCADFEMACEMAKTHA